MIISITGLIGSGKSTVAKYLVLQHGFAEESFASSLKDAISVIFNWDRELLEGKTNESREWREQVDPWWSKRLHMPKLTPRWILQYWGTEVCRYGFQSEIWVASLENKLKDLNSNVVIGDSRFQNEFNALRKTGAHLMKVTRGDDPEWVADAIAAKNGDHQAIARIHQLGIHESERAWLDTNFDAIIDNNGTTEELYKQIDDLLKVWN